MSFIVCMLKWRSRNNRHSWEDNIKMGLQDVGWGGLDWIDLAESRGRWRALVNAVMNLRVTLNGGNFLTWLRTCWPLRNGSAPWRLEFGVIRNVKWVLSFVVSADWKIEMWTVTFPLLHDSMYFGSLYAHGRWKTFIQSVAAYLPDYTASHPIGPWSWYLPPWEFQISLPHVILYCLGCVFSRTICYTWTACKIPQSPQTLAIMLVAVPGHVSFALNMTSTPPPSSLHSPIFSIIVLV